MSEDIPVEDKSVFEVLDFITSPLWAGDVNNENPPKLCGIEQLIYEINKDKYHSADNTKIHLHEAAILAAFLGTPRDGKIRGEWETLTLSSKIARIKTMLCEKGYTSFTRLY